MPPAYAKRIAHHSETWLYTADPSLARVAAPGHPGPCLYRVLGSKSPCPDRHRKTDRRAKRIAQPRPGGYINMSEPAGRVLELRTIVLRRDKTENTKLPGPIRAEIQEHVQGVVQQEYRARQLAHKAPRLLCMPIEYEWHTPLHALQIQLNLKRERSLAFSCAATGAASPLVRIEVSSDVIEVARGCLASARRSLFRPRRRDVARPAIQTHSLMGYGAPGAEMRRGRAPVGQADARKRRTRGPATLCKTPATIMR